jgi:hypothetical protein
MKLWDFRRYAHFALLIVLIVGIRACGGAAQAEDRLSYATRWAAEKAGLSGAKDTLDTAVKPRMAAATRSTTYSIYAATNRMMDSAESAVNGMAAWTGQQARNAETAVMTRIRSILGVGASTEPPPRDSSPTDTDPATTEPSR